MLLKLVIFFNNFLEKNKRHPTAYQNTIQYFNVPKITLAALLVDAQTI
jgi:hypothetical protein